MSYFAYKSEVEKMSGEEPVPEEAPPALVVTEEVDLPPPVIDLTNHDIKPDMFEGENHGLEVFYIMPFSVKIPNINSIWAYS